MLRDSRWENVLESAARLFSAQGFAATSVRQVAEGADITKAGLYYHIREKEDLLLSICEHSISQILEGARAALAAAEDDPVAGLSALIGVHTDFFRARPENLIVLSRERDRLSAGPRRRIARLEHAYLDLIRGVIAEGQRQGVLKAVDPTVAAFLLLSMLNGLDAWYRPDGKVTPDQLVRQIEAIYFTGLGAAGTEAPRRRRQPRRAR